MARLMDGQGSMRRFLVMGALLVGLSALGDELGVGIRAQTEKVGNSDAGGDPGVGLAGGELLVRWRFWPHWGLEGSLGSVSGSGPGYDRRTDTLLVTGALHLTPGHPWDVYLFLGIGGAADHITSAGAE